MPRFPSVQRKLLAKPRTTKQKSKRRSRKESERRKHVRRCETIQRKCLEWGSDVERMRSVVSTLKSEYNEHKHDIFLVRRQTLKEMIETAVTECKQIDDESVKRRARQVCPQYVDEPPADNGRLAQSEELKRNAERLAERSRLEGMNKDELKEEEWKLQTELAALQRGYRAMLRRLQTLGDAYATSKQLFFFAQRYRFRKQIIKAVIRTSSADEENQLEDDEE